MKSLRNDSTHFFLKPKTPRNILKGDSNPYLLFESSKVGSRIVNEMLPKLSKALGLRKLTNPMIKPINLELNGDQVKETFLEQSYSKDLEHTARSQQDNSNEPSNLQSDNDTTMELDIKNEVLDEEIMGQNSTSAVSKNDPFGNL